MATFRIPPHLNESERARFEKFLQRDPETGCLLWTGAKNERGYGEFRLRGKIVKAHRVAFVQGGGVLTEEKPLVLHGCPAGHNTSCCEFNHLRAGTPAENNEDMVKSGNGPKSTRGLLAGAHLTPGGRYRSQVRLNGKSVYLGTYGTAEEASAVALAAKTAP